MKKFMFSLAAAATFVASSAITIEPFNPANVFAADNQVVGATEVTAPTPDATGAKIRFCGTIYSASRLTSLSNTTYRVYIHVPATIADQLAGNQVNQIVCGPALQGSKFAGFVFATDVLPDQADGAYDSSTEASFKKLTSNTIPSQTFTLENPYTIKAGQDFYFGYVVTGCGSTDYPITYDSSDPNQFSGEAEMFRNGTKAGVNIGDYFGANGYLYAATTGDKTQITDFIEIGACGIGGYILPTVAPGAATTIKVPITNLGNNRVTKVEYTSKNGDKVITSSKTTSIANMKTTIYSLDIPALDEGVNEVEVTITKVNTTPVELKSVAHALGVKEEDTYARNFLVEEATGTWCGYCPAGIVGLEYMNETHPNDFIAIAAHSGDEFSVSDYNPIFALTGGSVPGSVVNRDKFWSVYPDDSFLESAYQTWMNNNPGAAKIEFSYCDFDGTNYLIGTKSEFGFSQSGANFAIAFAVTEDGLLGDQTNYYAGQNGAPGDWGSKPRTVKDWEYEDVARAIYNFDGVDGSVPANIVKGQTYEFNYTAPSTNVTDVTKTAITAILIDRLTGAVLNSARVRYADFNAGVEDVVADSNDDNQPAVYFNLQGQRIANPANGQIVIRRQGSKAEKIIVK